MPIAFALIYAFVLSSLPIDPFKDRLNYLTYASSSEIILQRYLDIGWLAALANEPLWLLININLSKISDPELTLRIIIFISAFFASFTIIRKNPRQAVWLMLFLLSPQVVKNHIIHLRQGLALSIFFLGFYSTSPIFKTSLLIAAGLIHSSFIVVSAIVAMVWFALRARISTFLKVAVVLAFLLALSSFIMVIGKIVGARQAFGYQGGIEVSGLGFVFWGIILLLFILNGVQFLRDHLFALSLLLTYLVFYFSSPFSARIFESGLLLVLVSCLSFGGWRRVAFISLYTTYSLVSYYNRLDQSWLGWGAPT